MSNARVPLSDLSNEAMVVVAYKILWSAPVPIGPLAYRAYLGFGLGLGLGAWDQGLTI